jgi:hypothetical protein
MREAVQESFFEHLARLSLFERRYRTDMETNMPELDRMTGAMRVQSYSITNLGRLPLRTIDLNSPNEVA